jgi:hypothetical protein
LVDQEGVVLEAGNEQVGVLADIDTERGSKDSLKSAHQVAFTHTEEAEITVVAGCCHHLEILIGPEGHHIVHLTAIVTHHEVRVHFCLTLRFEERRHKV